MAVRRAPAAGEMLLDEMKGERVVARRHRRVRREDGRAAHLRECGVPGRAGREGIAQALEHDERRMAFVQMPDGRRQPERAQGEHAAEPEDDLLLQPRVLAAAIEPRRELAIPRLVLFAIGVEQEQPDAADADFPHLDDDVSCRERDDHHARLPVERSRGPDRRVRPVDALVDFLLPAIRREALAEVALRVHEPDADQRHAEVARFLAVIAGEDAEAARVDRQRLMEREFRGEVRDDMRRVGRDALLPPRARGRRALVTGDAARAAVVLRWRDGGAVAVERRDRGVVEREVGGIRHARGRARSGVMRWSIITALCDVCRQSV